MIKQGINISILIMFKRLVNSHSGKFCFGYIEFLFFYVTIILTFALVYKRSFIKLIYCSL